MRCYRIARAPYANDITGEGSRRYGGRWTPAGLPAIYVSEHPALAAWEVLVHLGRGGLDTAPLEHHLVALNIPNDAGITRVPHVPHEPMLVGKEWLQSSDSLMLSVPSVVIPEAHNFIINPLHPDIEKISVADLGVFVFDARIR
jgi:RES domain-containing protein